MADRLHQHDSPPVSAEIQTTSSQVAAAVAPPPPEKPVPPPRTCVMKIPKDRVYRVPWSRSRNRKSQEHGPSFADLPCEITTNILLRLPMKYVLICRCVCKCWNKLIADPNFAKLHFTRTPAGVMIRASGYDYDPTRASRTLHLLEYEPERLESQDKRFCCFVDDFLEPNCNRHMNLEPKFKLPPCDAQSVMVQRDESKNGGKERSFAVVNSCNGFLCLCDPRDRAPSVVCNPITGEFIRLPEAPMIAEPNRLMSAGFGFDPKTNEYKVMRIRTTTHPRNMFDGMLVEMHILGTSTWRNVGVDHRRYAVGCSFPTYVNGALHWIGFDGINGSILTFNFDTERFQSFPSPPCVFESVGDPVVTNTSMGELRGSLYLCHDPYGSFVTMWVMEKYGIGGSWTRVFNISAELGRYDFNPPIVNHYQHKKGSAILMCHSPRCFIYYEPRNQVFKILKSPWVYSKFEAIPHIPSLISLKDALKGDNVEVLNVYPRKKMNIFSSLKRMLTLQVLLLV